MFRSQDYFDSQATAVLHQATHPCVFGSKRVLILGVRSRLWLHSQPLQPMRQQRTLAKSTDWSQAD